MNKITLPIGTRLNSAPEPRNSYKLYPSILVRYLSREVSENFMDMPGLKNNFFPFLA